MRILTFALGTIVLLLVISAGPLMAAPEALDKETRPAAVTVHQWRFTNGVALRHELVMLIAGTTLIVVAAVVRRTS